MAMRFTTASHPGTGSGRIDHRSPADPTSLYPEHRMPPISPPLGTIVAVDSHVHFHDLSDPAALLDSALAALRRNLGDKPLTAALLLTEPAARPTFATLKEFTAKPLPTMTAAAWRLEATEEAISLQARNRSGDTIHLIAGQQIVTAENLEVLALCALPEIADGIDLQATVRRVRQVGGLPLLPWGVGKWLGRRGRVISDFLAGSQEGPILVGDNGGRPAFWSFVPQFRQATAGGIRILRGSDPLRCSFKRRGPGSFGSLIDGPFDPARPGHSLAQTLPAAATRFQPFGSLESPWHFCRDQIALRLS
ncbi:hypothetical protein JWG42_09870 [Desulfoprunum benzoelyticum]|uniref:Uncharacterized protein n=1 Tax=Desulfoprunum benzoelyticum TaxID=1506996 RepID=A0A840UX02_9BACT|nr:hypothetical protein [Desulfoprunum benzoelyticum]MBB5347218.1 hypothetical protein [Desulfoprunum benzoelyticum]MBM9530456.1 hypothetical protein [Desulfoprunum benzoelyticum]